MTITAADVIQSARDAHPAFSETAINPGMARRMLTEVERGLTHRAREANPAYKTARTTLDVAALTAVTFPDGFTLPERDGPLLGGTVRFTATEDTCPLALTPWADRHQPNGRYAAYELNQTLYLCFSVLEWVGVDEIEVEYHPIPTAVAAGASLHLPDAAREAYIAELALRFAMRMARQAVELDVGEFGTAAEVATGTFIRGVRGTGRARVKRTKEAW